MSQRKRSRSSSLSQDDRAVKKQRVSSVDPPEEEEMSDKFEHKKGSVYRVAMHNFVTYNNVEFYPGPLLNCVIGPNGSGKSTIVCGLVLGLGGSPKLLGRAKQIKEFIRHGAHEAWVELELAKAKNGKNVVIRRTIHQDNSSEWRLNGKAVSKTEISKLIDSLNIQIGNVCQFLPQDKVVEFAKLDQYQLLRETEKAVGPPGMLEQHESLIDMYKNQSEYKLQLDTKKKHLEDLKAKNELLERDVLRFRERQKLLEKVEKMKLKRPWIELEAITKQFNQASTELKEITARYNEQEKKCEPLKVEIENIKQEIEKGEQGRTKKQNGAKTLDSQRKNSIRQLNEIDSRIQEIISNLEKLKSRHEDRLKQAEQTKLQINQYESQLQQLDLSNNESRLKELADAYKIQKAKENEIQDKLSEFTYSSNDLGSKIRSLDQELRKLSNAKERQLMDLRSRNSDAYNALQWLNSNQHLFQKKVYGPLILEVTIPDPYHARCFEVNTPNYLFDIFVCQTQHDYELFLTNIKDKQALNVNASNAEKISLDAGPPDDVELIKRFGCSGYLSDFIETTEIVSLILKATTFSHQCVVGSRATSASQFFSNCKTPKLFTPESVYQTSVSRYGNKNRSTLVYPLRECKYFKGVDTQRLNQIQAEVADLRSQQQGEESAKRDLQGQLREIRSKLDAIRGEREKIAKASASKKTLERKITEKQRQLEELMQEEDTSAKEEAYKKDIRKYLKKSTETSTKMRHIVHKLTTLALKIDYDLLQRSGLVHKLAQKQRELKDAQDAFAVLKMELNRCKDHYNHKKNEMNRQKQRANQIAPMTAELKELFKTFPDDIDKLNIAIEEAEIKANLNYRENPHLIEDYEKRSAEVIKIYVIIIIIYIYFYNSL